MVGILKLKRREIGTIQDFRNLRENLKDIGSLIMLALQLN